MEKLLKQVYHLYRKEIRELESKLELQHQPINREETTGCKKCLDLQIALQKKTDEYEKLLYSKNNPIFCNSEWIIDKTDDENDKQLIFTTKKKNSVTDIKFKSIFDDISPIQPLTRSKERFSPVPETPLTEFEAGDFKIPSSSKTFLSPPVVVLETLDEFISDQKVSNQNNDSPLGQTQTEDVVLSDDNEHSTDNFRSNSPILGGKEVVIDETAQDILLFSDRLNTSEDEFEVPKKIRKRKEDKQCQKSTKAKNKDTIPFGWQPSKLTIPHAKYTFEPAGSNFHKPKYKQMTLSQTFNDVLKNKAKDKVTTNIKTVNTPNVQENTEDDFDCTYVPSQYLASRVSVNPQKSSKESNGMNSVKELPSTSKCKQITDSESSDSQELLPRKAPKKTLTKICEEDSESKAARCSASKVLPSNFFDDFDELPNKSPKINYKYKRDAVKNKAERMKLNGQNCYECEKYYKNLGLSESEMKQRLNNCSKHRNNFPRSRTPDHFWSPEVPNTQESKRRAGQNDDEQFIPLRKQPKRLKT